MPFLISSLILSFVSDCVSPRASAISISRRQLLRPAMVAFSFSIPLQSALLFIVFQKTTDEKPADILFYISEAEDDIVPTRVEQFEGALPESHYFRRFVDKVREELRKK